jgi:hypothetical protein
MSNVVAEKQSRGLYFRMEKEEVDLTKNMPLVYPAHSKRTFYFTQHISKFVIEQGCVPLNPFMIFNYFLLDSVPRQAVYNANASLVQACDEIWCFGPIADGVLDEIRIAKRVGKKVRYFDIKKSRDIFEVTPSQVVFEKGLEKFRHEL